MEASSIDNVINIPTTGLAHTAAVNFVSELLTMTLAGQNYEVIIDPENFICDPGSAIETTESIKAEINCENVVETDGNIEITLSGTVENELGQKDTFTLFFFMWWDNSESNPVKNDCRKTFSTNSLLIQFEDTSEQLSESVFELDLFRKDLTGHLHTLGHGRGYLVFGSRV